MEIKSIDISRIEYGENKGKYKAAISLTGGQSYPADINIGIPDEALLPIVSIIQHAVAESMRRSAEEFTASVQASLQHEPATAVLENTNVQEDGDVPF